jgi:hypothetical protein
MAEKKRKRMSPEERAAWEAHLDERVRQLREAAARAKARLARRADARNKPDRPAAT